MQMWQLLQRQGQPLETKIRMSRHRIRRWYNYCHGDTYVSYSGGKDSTVVLDLVRELYPETPAVFVSTGLQYPEIRAQIRRTENVTWLRPTMPFTEVIRRYGYPVISKRVARFVSDLQNASEKNRATCNLRLTGYNRAGQYCSSMKLPNKWRFLVDAPFKISAQCCNVMKKAPFARYSRRTGRGPITGMMACESDRREQAYLRYGCLTVGTKHPMCHPIAFWTEHDVLSYIKQRDISYASVYGDIVTGPEGKLVTTGVARTGCIFCAFGAHLEKSPNRFQQLASTHPKLYDYCMNKLNMAEVLEYIGVEYQSSPQIGLWDTK